MVVHLRWMIGRDMEQVLLLEKRSFDNPWTALEFGNMMRDNNSIGMVAVNEYDKVLGYMIYGLHKNRLHLMNFAVHPDHQRIGIGKQMIDKLKSKLHPDRRNRINLEVRETNLAAQLFFKAMGFRAVNILKNYYDGTDDDAYVMVHRCTQVPEESWVG